MKRVLPLFLIALFLFGALSVPKIVTGMHVSMEISPTEGFNGQQLMSALPAQFVDRPIRVAVYEEENVTLPNYAMGLTTANFANVAQMLNDAGYSVTLLTEEDILNYNLKTTDFDVFVIVDNFPRESIINLVKGFWLGGGAMLTFNSAFGYLNFAGMLNPAWEGYLGLVTDPVFSTWNYDSWANHTITARHSSAKNFQIGDTIEESVTDQVTINVDDFPSEIGPDFVSLAVQEDDGSMGVACAIGNYNRRGGKIVHLPGNCSEIAPWVESIAVDAVDWLNPRPKGRVLFDYSHFPYYGIDEDDPCGFNVIGEYSFWRDYLVSHSYTVDKLYHSPEGNLTAENLAPYDMLVINSPEWNFTAAEVAAVASWVEAGGGLFVMGEWNSFFMPENHNLNYLLTSFDLSLNISDDYLGLHTTTDSLMHPINEGVSEVSFSGGSFVNHSGSAYPLWIDGGNTLIGGREYGIGRVIVSGDVNYLAEQIENSDNLQLSLSMTNWLTAGGATVLMYADTWEIYGGTANNNPYKGPVAAALRDLGVRFQLTCDLDYFNLSLHANEWDLVIFDNLNWSPGSYLDDIYDYAQGSGRLIMSTLIYDDSLYEYLWNHLGFTQANNTYDDPIPFYLWEDQHPIFRNPVEINTWNMSTPKSPLAAVSASNITALNNGSVLAGYSTVLSKTNASIILGPNGQFLTNSMFLTEYVNDTDDSTYPDCYELWMNEIAFMLRPFIDHPSDMQFEGGSTGHTITWHPTSWSPAEYTVLVDGGVAQTGTWSSEVVVFNVDDLLLGTHNVSLEVSDSLEYEADDEVTVLVVDTTLPTINSPANVAIAAGAAVSVTWTAFDLFPDSYRLLVNGTEELDEEWDGAAVAVNVGNLEIGVHNLTMEVIDTTGNRDSDTVMVTVTAGLFGLDPTTLLLLAGVGVVIVVVVLLVLKKRGAGASK